MSGAKSAAEGRSSAAEQGSWRAEKTKKDALGVKDQPDCVFQEGNRNRLKMWGAVMGGKR